MVKNTSTLPRDKNEDKTIQRISKKDTSRKMKKKIQTKSHIRAPVLTGRKSPIK
jgi:hypothetical protein